MARGHAGRLRVRWRPAHVASYVYLVALCALIAAPYLWAVFESFKPTAEAGLAALLPRRWTLDNYRAVLTFRYPSTPDPYIPGISFTGAVLHSSLVALSVMAAALVTSTLVAFVLSAYRFRGKESLFVALIGTFMVPFVCVVIPLYVNIVNLGLNNTLSALVVTGLWSPLGILVMRQFMESMPGEMLEAARMDGAGEWRVVVSLVLPLSTSAVGILAVYTFMRTWDDSFWPSIVLQTANNWTLTLVPTYFPLLPTALLTASPVAPPFQMALAVLTTVPVAVIYLCVARFFIRGIGAIAVHV